MLSIGFDLDLTLIDSSQSILMCIEKSLYYCEISPQIPINSDLIGPKIESIFTSLVQCDPDDPIIFKLVSIFKNYYDECCAQESFLYPHIYSTLHELTQYQEEGAISIFLATQKRKNPTLKILNHHGIDSFFQKIYTSDDYAYKTQALNAHRQNHPDLTSIWYVGDHPLDLESSINAQVNVFFPALWGLNSDQIARFRLQYKNSNHASIFELESPEEILSRLSNL